MTTDWRLPLMHYPTIFIPLFPTFAVTGYKIYDTETMGLMYFNLCPRMLDELIVIMALASSNDIQIYFLSTCLACALGISISMY